jgi:DNA-binding transcriptional regulator YiaG
MSAELMERVCFELPSESLRIVEELVSKLGGKTLNIEEQAFFKAPTLPLAEKVAKLLKGARLRANLTQKEIAKIIGVPQSHISEYEKNKRKIPQQKATLLAKILNTSEAYFLDSE